MKTTVTITVENVEGGHNVKINHVGDQLDNCAPLTAMKDGLDNYFESIGRQGRIENSLKIMKMKRQEMKSAKSEVAEMLDNFQDDGVLIKEEAPTPF